MGRTARDKRDLPHPKPVERIELSEKHVRLRLVLTIGFAVLGVGAIVYALAARLSAEPGWTTIEANASSLNCSEDFVFQYRLGEAGMSATAEKKALTILYSEAAQKAYENFDAHNFHGTLHNICYINRHPNEVIEVDALLYQALETCVSSGYRGLYLMPIYEQYNTLFFCNEDWETESFDPYQNAQLSREYEELLTYALDPDAIDLQLLGDCRVRLEVSAECLDYWQKNWGSGFLDFYWMKNAFIVDYFAEVMIENGYTNGYLSSYDGFVRNLDESGTVYSIELYDRAGNVVYPAAVIPYTGPKSFVCLRDYMLGSRDRGHYYAFADGEIRTCYVDTSDGFSRTATDSLMAYSGSKSCGEILLRVISIYIADEFLPGELWELSGEQIYAAYCEDGVVNYNDPGLVISELYEGLTTVRQETVSGNR